MSTEVRTGERAPPEEPDVGFQCGVGLSVGTVLAGVVSVALVAAGGSAVSVLGSYPTALTAGLLAGVVLSRNAAGLAERIGADHRRWLYGIAPATVFGAGTILAWLGGLPRVAAVAALAAVPITASGLVLAGMARNRYVDLVTGEPTATWRWKRTGLLRPEYAIAAAFLVPGLVQALLGRWIRAAFWLGYAALMLVVVVGRGFGDRLDLPSKDADDGYSPSFSFHSDRLESSSLPELAVHDVGLVTSQGMTTSLIPWSKVEDVTLTDDELVIDRGWRSIRCKRDVIDDPEGAYEAVRDALER